jgi:hypothetical protein
MLCNRARLQSGRNGMVRDLGFSPCQGAHRARNARPERTLSREEAQGLKARLQPASCGPTEVGP